MDYIIRLSKLLLDKGTKALRVTLDDIHNPAKLPGILNAKKMELLKLKPLVINDTQWDLLFPPSGNPPDSKTFDVTLLSVLLRNICGLAPPKASIWKNMPPDKDRTKVANITRVRVFRNQVAHTSPIEIDEAKFENLWQKISESLVDLKIPKQEIDDLKTGPLTTGEEICVQTLKDIALQEEESKNMLHDLIAKFKRIEQQVSHDERQTDSAEERLRKFAKHEFKSLIGRKVKYFHLGTRDWLIKKVDSWFTAEDESILLITAGPGFGKSVFAAELCDRFKKIKKLAACHFCELLNSNLGDPMTLLESLASHMCENVPGYKVKLLDQLRRHNKTGILNEAFQIYFQNPLDGWKGETRLIVIDGLNERANDDKSEMANLIARKFPGLSKCVKILVTSRPELDLQTLNCIQIVRIEEYKEENNSDLLKYLNVCLPSLAASDEIDAPKHDHPHSNVLSAIVEKCEGSFQYAFHVQNELGKRKDLDTMTSKEILSSVPKGMNDVYKKYFDCLRDELEAVMNEKPDILKLLQLLVASETPIPLTFVARVLNLVPDSIEMREIICKVNEAISCLLYVWDDLVTLPHNSIYDWLLGKGYCNRKYTVKISDSYNRLYELCIQVAREIEDELRLGNEPNITNEVKYVMDFINDYEYLMARKTKIDNSMQPQSSQSVLRQREDVETIKSPEKASNLSKKRKSTEPTLEEITQGENSSCFKEIFLDSKHNIKKEIDEKLRSFHWLCGGYGLIPPNKKKPRPHVYLTVKRGTTEADARRDLEERFNFDTTKYFELHQEPKRKQTMKLLGLGEKKSNVESGTSMCASARPAPGGRVVAAINVGPNPLRVPEENETCDFFDAQVTAGTLTMFCYKNGHHYALTCFHVGCESDESRLNTVYRANEVDDMKKIRGSLPHYVGHAEEKKYYYTESSIENTNNESVAVENNGCSYTPLGQFHSCHFDNECDILSLKLSHDVQIDCKIADVTTPDWDSIFDELHENIFQNTGNPVIVEKIGPSSGLTHGYIVGCHFSHFNDKELMFQDAIVIKGFSGPFVEDGESGSLVFFHDKNGQKQAFAYCVCEVDEFTYGKDGMATISSDDDSDNSTWSSCECEDEVEEEGESEVKFTNGKDDKPTNSSDDDSDGITWSTCECEDEVEEEGESEVEFTNGEDDKPTNSSDDDSDGITWSTCECEDEVEEEGESEVKDKGGNGNESEDGWEDNDGIEWEESDFEVVFDEGEYDMTVTGPYIICLRLDTALEKLGFENAGCFNNCGSK